METGATVGQTLLEEVMEETNLNIELEQLCYLEQHQVNRSWVVVGVYRAQINSARAVQISHEHMQYGFFSEVEIKNLLTPPWVGAVIRNK